MLTAAQQAVAVLGYVKKELAQEPTDAQLLQDPFFLANLDYYFNDLYEIYTTLYGHRNDCLESLVELVKTLAQSWDQRSPHLKEVDMNRLMKTQWYMSNNMLGGMCYIDLYAGNLQGVRDRIPYFRELGLTYLHLMPCSERRSASASGCYGTVYRNSDERLGTLKDLAALAKDLHENGICLAIDLMMNHTSNEHEWAKKAASGDSEFSGYYWIFPDPHVPNEFERTAKKMSGDGNFVQLHDGRWIWSTFQSTQWDLNYSNPAVFRAMAAEMLFLANLGVDVFRLDSVAHIWKKMGTACENLPEAHSLVRAFNAICRIAAPSILFKSETVAHPRDVVSYNDSKECQLSYNSLEMSLYWEALATRNVNMLQQALERYHSLADNDRCHWVNYVRSHEDIRWTFSNEDAHELGISSEDHRRFLNSFYVNRHQGSFARGVPFEDNKYTGDCRIAGTTASLAGLESGEIQGVERMLLLYSICFSTGGISLLYLGDEVGQLNDYNMLRDPEKASDTQWVHRPSYPARRYEDRLDETTQAGKLFAGMKHLVSLRKKTEEIAGGRLVGFHTGNQHVLGYQRFGRKHKLLVLCNFHDTPQRIRRDKFAAIPSKAFDLVSGVPVDLAAESYELKPHQYAWLRYE